MNRYPPEFSTIKNRHLYMVWQAMIRRCSPTDRMDSRYYFYRGIRVCEEWKYWPAFADFCLAKGWRRGLQIDRIDNAKGYNPSNCRFATAKEQHHNRDLMTTYRHIKASQTRRWAKPFLCVETGETFLTQIEAQRRHGVDRKTLRLALSGIYQQAGGLRWRYLEAS